MKQILLMIAVVALVGCGESKEAQGPSQPEPATPASLPALDIAERKQRLAVRGHLSAVSRVIPNALLLTRFHLGILYCVGGRLSRVVNRLRQATDPLERS
mgnify:CR=1 FL=1